MSANETPRGNGALEGLAGRLDSFQDTTVPARLSDTRRRPMALDTGTSSDAAATPSDGTIGTVKAAILQLLRERPGTDEELSVRYAARGGPRFPRVTDQRLRTARAALVRAGHVRDSGALAFTSLGNRCAEWEVTR